jgi:V/A-type H+-transporting ATPase subunit K
LLKKRPEAFGSGLVLAAIPATQGLYGFVGFILCSDLVHVPVGTNVSIFNGSIVFGAGLAVALVCYGSALWQSKILANGIAGIASGKNVFGQTMILAAFPEFYAILSLVTAILMLAFAK